MRSQRWVEVEPLLFREVGGQGTLAFDEDGEGRITRMFFGDMPIMAFTKLAWYQTSVFHVSWLVICVALLLSAVVIWPIDTLLVGFLGGWRTSNGHRPSLGLPQVASWLAWGASTLSIVLVAGFVIALSDPLEIAYGIPPMLRAVLVMAPVIAVLTVGAMICTIPVWKRAFWSMSGRVHYRLVTLAALGFVWFLYYWNLLGFWV